MSKIRLGLPIVGVAACALGLVGCADESPWGNVSDEKGYIDFSLTADSGISTKKPVFRSGEADTRANDLSSYMSVPSADDFSIKLEKSDGSYAKTWSSLADFKSEAASTRFNSGVYTLTAFYGTKGNQDFEAPYFEASESIRVLADETTEVSLTAELKNSMVKINYSDGFVEYMSDYHTNLSTQGKAEEIIFNSAEQRAAFIEPNNASLTVHFTTKEKGYTSSLNLGQFAPEAKTLHNITLDVTENATGTSTLDVVFDEGLSQETVTIDLTDELLTSQPPVINCVGFENGQTVDMLEGSSSETKLQMNIVGQNVIKSAILTVDCDKYIPGWGKEIDLCNATAEQQAAITASGINARGFFGIKSEGAFLDLTEYGKSLRNGVYTISLKVTDDQGVVSETASVILNSLPVTVEVVGDPIAYGSGRAFLTMDYNGLNPEKDLSFQAWNAAGIYENVRIISCEEDMSTRAYETHRYIFTLGISATTRSMIMIKVLHNNNNIGEYEVPVIAPEYGISAVDAFSRYAYLKIETPNAYDPTSTVAVVVNNIQLKDGDGNSLNIIERDPEAGILTVSGLTPASTYSMQSNINVENNAWNTESLPIETEAELTIPNGDFSQNEGVVSSNGTLQIGGEYVIRFFGSKTYKNYVSFSHNLPQGWGTVNDLTASKDALNRNTWFVVPSSWVDGGVAYMRNVGYNLNGETPAKSDEGKTTTNYFCQNSPSDDQLNRAAGEIFLGDYSADRSKDGISFSSRPQHISFKYKYSALNEDKGEVKVEVLDGSGNVIGNGVSNIESSSDFIESYVDIKYTTLGVKASKLKVNFKSSYKDIPITIPTGMELDDDISEGTFMEYITKGGVTLSENSTYHALATGSELWIDDVMAVYSDLGSSSSAPKRKSSKSRK